MPQPYGDYYFLVVASDKCVTCVFLFSFLKVNFVNLGVHLLMTSKRLKA